MSSWNSTWGIQFYGCGDPQISTCTIWYFYNGKTQQDSKECLMMLIETINKGWVPYCGANNDSTGISLSDILFPFMLEKYVVCDVCGLRSPCFESCSVLCSTPTYTSSMQVIQQKWQKSCLRYKKNNWHVESNYILQPQKYLIIIVNRFRYININVTKDRYSIPMYMTIMIGPH